LEKKPGVALKDLLGAIAVGARDEDLFTSLANRLDKIRKASYRTGKTTVQRKGRRQNHKASSKRIIASIQS
jgi:type I restriction enzyme R subunit